MGVRVEVGKTVSVTVAVGVALGSTVAVALGRTGVPVGGVVLVLDGAVLVRDGVGDGGMVDVWVGVPVTVGGTSVLVEVG